LAENKEEQKGSFHFSPRPNRAAEIDWHEWGVDAFRRSLKDGKPVLLSISAVWCHWCHVMDETSFSDDEVIRLINEYYIPVRVDNDRRPDINKRYNQGGWPTIAMLTAEGEIITGVTYLEPETMRKMLNDIAGLYSNNRPEIDAAIKKIQAQRAEFERPAPGELSQAIMAQVLEVAGDVYDKEMGGFGALAKFPYANVLNLILTMLAEGSIGELEDMLTTTLDAMAAGGMYDQLEGGFFRYSTNRDWSVPHYEKMLEDNAALLAVYAEASHILKSDEYERVARDVYRFMDTVMLNRETGAFSGSQDADEVYYGLDESARKEHGAPYVDPTVYSGWNALAASSILRCFQVFGDEEFRGRAIGVLDFIWSNMWDAKLGVYRFHDGMPQVPGLLADTALLTTACLDAYESGAGEIWLSRSIEAATWMLTNLEDESEGGFYDSGEAPGEDGLFPVRIKPPVENSQAASALIRLRQNTGQVRFGEAAERALLFFAGSYKELGLFSAEYAIAVQRLLEPPVRVTIAGPPGESGTAEMIRAAHKARVPFRSVEVLDPEIHSEELDATGYGYAGKPIAYICIGASCQPPVTDPADLPGRLEAGWASVSR